MLSCWCFVILTGAVLHGVYIGCARFSNATGFRCSVGRIQNSTVWPSVTARKRLPHLLPDRCQQRLTLSVRPWWPHWISPTARHVTQMRQRAQDPVPPLTSLPMPISTVDLGLLRGSTSRYMACTDDRSRRTDGTVRRTAIPRTYVTVRKIPLYATFSSRTAPPYATSSLRLRAQLALVPRGPS